MELRRALGGVIETLRRQRDVSRETIAREAGLSATEVEDLERGVFDPRLSALDRVAAALSQTVGSLLIQAEEISGGGKKRLAPTVNPDYMDRTVPLPKGLTHDQLEAALNRTATLLEQVGLNPGNGDIQWNIYSGAVSNLATKSIAEVSSFAQNKDTEFPDLYDPRLSGADPDWGLEIKATNRVAKGGESHNPGRGWYMIIVYKIIDGQTHIVQVETCLLELDDWNIHERKEKSKRTRTATTFKPATQRLRAGSVYLDPSVATPALSRILRKRRQGVLL